VKTLLSVAGALLVLNIPIWAGIAAGALLPLWLLGLIGVGMAFAAVPLSRADATLPIAWVLLAVALGGAAGLLGANAMPVLAVLTTLAATVVMVAAAFLSVMVYLFADDPYVDDEFEPTL